MSSLTQEVLCASQFRAGSSCLLMIHHVMSGMSRKRWLVDQKLEAQQMPTNPSPKFWFSEMEGAFTFHSDYFNDVVSAIKMLHLQQEELDKDDSMGNDKS